MRQRLQAAYRSRRGDLAIPHDQAAIDLLDADPHEVGHRFIGLHRRRDPQPAPRLKTTVVLPATNDAMWPLPGDTRVLHRPGGVAPTNALFANYRTETDPCRADRAQVPDSVIFAALHGWIRAADPDRPEPACADGTATPVLHRVDPRTGRRR